jgi:murein DD-endopeptidase MepM/ murein hydrolase activator NlpD
MALRQLKPYTVLITATGKAPITLTIRPTAVMVGLLVGVGVPLAWIGTLIYQNTQLLQRHQTLTETATEVLTELHTLDAEIEVLKDRAGLPDGGPASGDPPARPSPPQGGPAAAVDPEALFTMAQQKMPGLEAALDGSIKPALEATLEAEAKEKASFPDGQPLAGKATVSSEFGLRANPFGGGNYEMHEGIDFVGPVGKPILATADGVVVKAEYIGGYGNHVKVDHGYNYETLYAHLSEIQVHTGDRVKRGEVVGALGNTGRSSGPHLHYGIYRNGQAVNPRYYLKLEDAK